MERENITVRYKDIEAFLPMANQFLNTKKRTPSSLTHALQRTVKILTDHKEDLDILIADLNAKYALKDNDENKAILKNADGSFKYNEAGQTALNAAVKKARDKEIKYESYRATTIPEDLEVIWYSFFVPFVIAEYQTGLPDASLEKQAA